jgi:hypothetical protein
VVSRYLLFATQGTGRRLAFQDGHLNGLLGAAQQNGIEQTD